MTVALAKDVEAFVEEQVRSGACADAGTLVNDILRTLHQHRQPPFGESSELEAWLLEAADSSTTPLAPADFEAIRFRARARLSSKPE